MSTEPTPPEASRAGLFVRLFRHLLPDALAFRLFDRVDVWTIGDGSQIGDPGLVIGGAETGRTFDRFFAGLTGAFADARAFVDDVLDDLYPSTTRQFAEWEDQHGITFPPALQADRVTAIASAWKQTGGQSPKYIQDRLQDAGFPLFVHEWWVPGSSYTPRNPTSYIEQPLVGSVQCGDALAQCGESIAQCDDFLTNEPGYFASLDLTPKAPPALTAERWRLLVYVGGETFGDSVEVPAERRRELEHLLRKLVPSQNWIVYSFVTYA